MNLRTINPTRLKLKALLTSALVLASMVSTVAFAEGKSFITIGTGSVTGVYYPAGNNICRLVNAANPDKNGLRCTAEATGGSVYNLNTLRSGELDFAIAQSDSQFKAYNGVGTFETQGKFPELRAVFSLHAEPFNVVVRADSGIKSIQDLKGKRVNIGNPGSGDRDTMNVVMAAMGWTTSDFAIASEFKGSERSQALCDNKIDAFVYVVGHPNSSIKESTVACGAKLISVTGPEIDKIIMDNPYFAKTVIPESMYTETSTNSITSFGALATLVTTSKVPDEVVYQVVKAIFEKFDSFKYLHPAFATLKKENMVKDGLSIPLHPGALRYYKEVGLIK